ncbi:hypothetical protein GCM10022198_00360 [Klugiella xanthotipulae]|uniref:Uncharacterized protein n=1 Tax=Klugiella xanthotipulae TaxID=244735 RepID=A0A543I5F6_9MICO|nr:hypothetical protein [Klugiella xanthotipulae]TQM65825.1 hypothetical protein FB466_0638 [Klugiella xanthotipulae]
MKKFTKAAIASLLGLGLVFGPTAPANAVTARVFFSTSQAEARTACLLGYQVAQVIAIVTVISKCSYEGKMKTGQHMYAFYIK